MTVRLPLQEELARPRGRFASFSIRSYRFQWGADLLSAWGFEMETLIIGWYVLVETDSALMLAIVGSLRFGGTLIAPFTGVLADRVARRGLLIAMRGMFAALAATIMVAGLFESLALWYLFVVAALSGLLRPSEMIVRESLLADTVPTGLLTNALGFSRTTMDSARIAGALLGAGLLSSLGIGAAYAVITVIYLLGITLTMRITHTSVRSLAPAAPWAELKAGISYIRATPDIATVMLLAFLVNFTAYPLTHGLLPAIARDVYGLDENGLARMIALAATGALVGSVLMALWMRQANPVRLMIGGLLGWHLLIAAFLLAPDPGLGYLLLLGLGASMNVGMIAMSVTLMGRAEADLRGRVMGVRMLAVYGLPLGLLTAGALIEVVGLRATLLAYATVGSAAIVAVALRRRTLWRAQLS